MKNYCIISHTHWDREWYLPFEQFRIRLVDMMDNMLDILASDAGYRFHLDAQTIVLEDFLEIKPERKGDIEKYVKEGRLLIGPWYVQNDFYLTSGEATVRNLIIGSKIANDFGKCMDVGYAADQFGLCAQLPQILNKFGLDSCVFGRGFGREGRQFYWQSEDGSKVLCEHMYAWYNNLQRLPQNADGAYDLITSRGRHCLSVGKTDSALLMNGVDHLEAQEDLTEILEKVRPMLSDDEKVFQDTLPEYVERMKSEIAEKNLELDTYNGELRDRGSRSVLTGTASSRVYLKQMNVRAQSGIEGRFEPVYTLLDMLGIKKYPKGYAEYLWKTLIKNHPHDSICGCSVDAVHRKMVDRFERIEENLESLCFNAEEALLMHTDRVGLEKNDVLIMCVNNSVHSYKGVFKVDVDLACEDNITGFDIFDDKGKKIPFEVLEIKRNIGKRILSPINLPGEKRVDRYTLLLSPGKLDGVSRKTFILRPSENVTGTTVQRKKSAYLMENRYLKVKINRNGTVSLTDKQSGVTIDDMLLCEDNCDRGDSYIYKESDGSEMVTNAELKAKISVVSDTPMRQARSIKFTLKVDRPTGKGKIPVELLLTLDAGSRKLDVTANVDNSVKYHRLRLHIPTGVDADKNYSGQAFDIVWRDRDSVWENDETHPFTGFVGMENGTRGLAVLTEGLFEYEQTKENALAVTLLRANGRITGGFGDIDERNVTEGWDCPECQCIGKYSLKLAVYPYIGGHIEAAVAQAAESFVNPPYAVHQHNEYNKMIGGRPFVQAANIPLNFYRPLENADIVFPKEYRVFKLEEEKPNAMMLSAFKASEDGKGHIIRFYNTASENVSFSLDFTKKLTSAYIADLAEREIEALPILRGHKIQLFAKPKEIITVKI